MYHLSVEILAFPGTRDPLPREITGGKADNRRKEQVAREFASINVTARLPNFPRESTLVK